MEAYVDTIQTRDTWLLISTRKEGKEKAYLKRIAPLSTTYTKIKKDDSPLQLRVPTLLCEKGTRIMRCVAFRSSQPQISFYELTPII